MIKISTSILAAKDRTQAINKLNNTNTDYIHIDSIDGLFAPNTQMNLDEIQELLKHTNKPFDIHLMHNDPIKYINNLNDEKIKIITIHKEIEQNIEEIIDTIKNKGYKCGLSIKPNTQVKKILPYINKIDLVLIMSVEPGFSGQKFIPNSIDKAKDVKNLRNDLIVEMDGGINITNINEIKDYIDIAVVGSYITNNDNYQEAINNLKN